MSDVQVTYGQPPAAALLPQPDPSALARLRTDADRTVTFGDRFGRQIAIKKVRLSRRLALGDLLGEAASAETRMNALAAISIMSIDGAVVPPPNSRLELDALLDRLEAEGVFDVFTRYMAEFAGPAAADAQTRETALKNG
jgi:hypothetical protein